MNRALLFPAGMVIAGLLAGLGCRLNAKQAADDGTAQADSTLLQRAHEARIIGDPAAPVRIYEATDFSCPTCKAAYERNADSLKTLFVDTGEAALIYVASPLPFLLRSYHGAEAAFCAGGLGGREPFLAMIEALYRHQDDWRHLADPRGLLVQYGEEAGVSGSALTDCLDRNAVAPLILSDLGMLGGLRVQGLDIPGTPTYIFNEEETFYGVQPLSRFREAIASARDAERAQ